MTFLPLAACLLAWMGLLGIHTEEGRKLLKLAAVLGVVSLFVVGIGGGH